MLDVEILEHRFDHQVHIGEAGVVDRSAEERHHVGELDARDLLAGEPLLEDVTHRRETLGDAPVVGVAHPHQCPLLHGDRGDPGTHEAGAKNSQLHDRMYLRRRLAGDRRDTRIFLQCGGRKEEVDELFRHITDGHLAEEPRLLAIPMARPSAVARRDCVYRGERRREMSVRLLERLLARLSQHDPASRRVLVQEEAGDTIAMTTVLSRTVGDVARPLNGYVAQDRRMDKLVHQPDLQCLFRPDVLAGENDVQRGAHADEARQTLRTACARYQAELNFGESENGLRMFRGDAVRRREGDLERPAEARAMNRAHQRRPHPLD